MTNSICRQIVSMELGSLTRIASSFENARALGLRSSGSFCDRGASGVLKGHDLGEELVVQMFHLLPFTGYIFSIMCRFPTRSRTGLAASPSPPSYQQTFGEIELHMLIACGCLRLPPVKVQRQSLS